MRLARDHYLRVADIWRLHMQEVVERTYAGAADYDGRLDAYFAAFRLATPIAVEVLTELDAQLLGGQGRVWAEEPREVGPDRLAGSTREPAGGWLGTWNLSWPALENRVNRRVCENTIAVVMAELGLAARVEHRRKHTTRPGRGRWRAPDLIGRDFGTDRVNHKWYGDGTEISTGEGKLYLDSVLDMGSRRIIGFAMGAHHDAALAEAALQMAVAVRGGRDAIEGVIMHTDQGSEYTAGVFRAACARVGGITQSMGRVASALDNSVIESWHSTLEFELRSLEHFATRAQARVRTAAWIEEYNHDRRHSALAMASPIQYELDLARQQNQEAA